MNKENKNTKMKPYQLICFAAFWLSFYLLFKLYFSSTVILFAQAPNYGDIKLDIVKNQQVIQQKHFLVNPQHMFYTHRTEPLKDQASLRFYFDRRHQHFSTKGILIIDKELSFHWFSADSLYNQSKQHNISKSSKSRYTAHFKGFGDLAHFEIKFSDAQSINFFLLLALITLLVLSIILIGNLIYKVLQKVNFLDRHKLRILMLFNLLILFSSLAPIFKITLVLCTLYIALIYLLNSRTILVKHFQYLTTVLFFVVIFSGFGSQADLLKQLKKELSQQDNTMGFSFFEQLGIQFSKSFLFKNEIGHLNSLLKVDVFDRSPTSKVIIGKQGTMFEGTGIRRVEGDKVGVFDNVSDYLGRLPFKDYELTQWEQVIRQRHCWLNNQNIDYLFTMAPTKALVYPELLPQVLLDIKSKHQSKPRIELLDAHLQKADDLPVLNLTPTLIKAKELQDYPKLFYRTDFHWNYLGAYYAYKAIVDELALLAPEHDLSPIALTDFDFEINQFWAHDRFLGLLGLLPKWYNNEHYIILKPNPDNPLHHIEPYNTEGVFDIPIPNKFITTESGQTFRVESIENPKGKLKTILVIGDSFIQKSFPMLSGHAKHNYFYRAVFDFPYQLIEELKPDIVVQEILNMYLLNEPPNVVENVAGSTCK